VGPDRCRSVEEFVGRGSRKTEIATPCGAVRPVEMKAGSGLRKVACVISPSAALGLGCLLMSHCEFHYSYLLPQKPGILPFDETITKSCRRCGATFTTKSRIRKRCDACQEVVAYEKQQKANARLKARRAAKRALLRG
jgi:hypothetical protein